MIILSEELISYFTESAFDATACFVYDTSPRCFIALFASKSQAFIVV